MSIIARFEKFDYRFTVLLYRAALDGCMATCLTVADNEEYDAVRVCDCVTDGSTVWSGNNTATYMGQPSSANYCTLFSQSRQCA